jgi:hypothetical protein
LNRAVLLALRWVAPLLAFGLALRPIDNFDIGFQLRTGQLVLESGIPTTDPFSFPGEGQPWALEQWLGPLAFWLAYRAGGIAGVIVLKALAAAGAVALVTRAGERVCGDATVAAVAGLLACTAAQARFNAQANIFSLLGVAAVLLACAQLTAGGTARAALWLLPVFALWPHVHPGYLSGVGILLIFAVVAAGQGLLPARLRSALPPVPPAPGLLSFALGCAAAALGSLALVHPRGLSPLLHVWEIFSSPTTHQNITEYFPLWRSYGFTAPLLALWAVPVVAGIGLRLPLPLPLVAIAVVLGLQAVQVGRVVADAALGAAPLWAFATVALVKRLEASHHLGRLAGLVSPERACAALVAAAAVTGLGHVASVEGPLLAWTEDRYPKGCYDWIDASGLPARGFNDLGFGGSFIFHFNGRRKTFIDGRASYSDAFFENDYTPIKQAAPGFQQIVRKWGIDWFLLYPTRFRALQAALQADPAMRLVHLEPGCAIYARASLPIRGALHLRPTDKSP